MKNNYVPLGGKPKLYNRQETYDVCYRHSLIMYGTMASIEAMTKPMNAHLIILSGAWNAFKNSPGSSKKKELCLRLKVEVDIFINASVDKELISLH